MDNKWIKVIGIGATVLGGAATLIGNWAGEKQLDAKIAEKAAEAVANLAEKES